MSALTSLLVRDDAVSVRQIEDALQRQVLDGGELDTALLELGALPENVLIAYRAVSEYAEPAGREEVMTASPAARSLLTAEIAASLGVVPLAFDESRLVVASQRPLTAAESSALMAHTGRAIEYRITSELRVHAALERFYGRPMPRRLASLLRRVDALPAGDLVQVAQLKVSRSAPLLSRDPLPSFDESEDFEAALESAFARVSGTPPSSGRSGADGPTRPLGPVIGSPGRPSNSNMPLGRAGETQQLGSFLPEHGPAPELRPRMSSAPPAPRPQLRLPQGPLTAAVAEAALAEAEERDAVMEIFFRFARQYFDSTVLLALKDDRVRGMQAYNTSGLLDARDVSVPMLRGGAIDDLVRSLLPRVVDLTRKDEDRVLALAMKRLSAQPAALIPVCIKRRVVALIYGDRAGHTLYLDELAELLGLCPHVTRAFERIIHTRKAMGVANGAAAAEFRARDLQHAPTQRSIQLPPAAQSVASALADAAIVAARAQEALASLGARRSGLTPQPQPHARPPERAAYATERVPSEQPPTDGYDAPARYLSKPPPGTGRYRSAGPRQSEATGSNGSGAPKKSSSEDETQPLRPSRTPARSRPAAAPVPPAPARSSVPPARVSVPPLSSAPPASSAMGRASLHASKPPPGTGKYHSHGTTTELISVPPGPIMAPTTPAPAPPPSGSPHEDSTVPAIRISSNLPRAHVETHALDLRLRAEQLLHELCQRKIDEELLGVHALRALGEPALGLLLERFPGPLWFDRRRAHARVPFGRDVSPVCRALDAFGEEALPRLAPLLRSGEVETRYYATLFACDRVHPGLLEPLLERLFDDDPQIRLLVRDVLPHYRRLPGFAHVAERLCAQAAEQGALLRTRLAAIDAIAMLRDAGSVPTLIELSTHADKQISVPAHRALTAITCQDFGKATKKWRAWYEENADRPRVEWLIEGLMHADEGLRSAAGLELQKLTQVYYGYVAAASKRDRELAQKRYWDWWRAEGRSKF